MKRLVLLFLFCISLTSAIAQSITFNMHDANNESKKILVTVDVKEMNVRASTNGSTLFSFPFFDYAVHTAKNRIGLSMVKGVSADVNATTSNYFIIIRDNGNIVVKLADGREYPLMSDDNYDTANKYNQLSSLLLTLSIEENTDEYRIYEFEQLQVLPEFPGGRDALMQYLQKNVIYPPRAQENGIEGTVVCKFVISKTGDVSQITVVKALEPECDKEVVRVISRMPKWKPGKIDGKPVKCYFQVPVNFILTRPEPPSKNRSTRRHR